MDSTSLTESEINSEDRFGGVDRFPISLKGE